MGKIFISHSSKDISVVKKFITFLTSIGVQVDNIFCSSLEGQGIQNGNRISDSIHQELKNSCFIVFLITKNFIESRYCTQELGAIWAFGENYPPFFIFRFEDVDLEEIKGFINKEHKISFVDTLGLSEFYDELKDKMPLSNSTAIINRAISSLIVDIKKDVKILVEDKDKTEKELEAEKIKQLESQYNDLPAGAKEIIARIFYSHDGVEYYQVYNGTVGLLSSQSFIFPTIRLISGHMKLPFALESWVISFIKNNKKISNELKQLVDLH